MNLYVKTERLDGPWPMHCHELYAKLGVRGGHLPDEGVTARLVQGILVWATPKRSSERRGFHRVLARCPVCSLVVSAGRLRQHSRVHR